MFLKISSFISNYNILTGNQYGFRSNRSTELAVLELNQRVLNNMNDKKLTLGIFIDLTKAFDIIDQKILLTKLNFYGFRGKFNAWFKSYLEQASVCLCGAELLKHIECRLWGSAGLYTRPPIILNLY